MEILIGLEPARWRLALRLKTLESKFPSPLAGEGGSRRLTDEGSCRRLKFGVLPDPSRKRLHDPSSAPPGHLLPQGEKDYLLVVKNDWIQSRAKQMRHEPVLYEQRLWKLLRDRRLEGLKFRRQVVIGRYVADFVCFRHRLIVEADGPMHDERAVQDAERDAFLAGEGFRVLRFDNVRIENRPHEVVAEILAAVG